MVQEVRLLGDEILAHGGQNFMNEIITLIKETLCPPFHPVRTQQKYIK
jgi:hypothetical protein